ncbi:MAG: Clp protease ClpP [Prevotella sp.]|nr:Clp protease ClpP [Prevotella sp.]
MKQFFNIIPGEDTCCILLYGDIGDSYGSVSSGQVVRELLAAEAAYKHIDVRINSNGGEVYTGIAIYNALRNSKADIRIYVDGIAASMASVIALCGKPVEMSKYARLMLHSVSGSCYGDKKELQGVLKEIEGLEDTLCQMLAAKLGQSADNIKAAYFDGEDHWLTADEALLLGLIDGIYDADPVPADSTPEQIYAIFNNRLAKPQNELDMNFDELKKRPQFQDCASEDDVLRRIDQLETRAAQADGLEEENATLRATVEAHEAAAEEAAAAERATLLDAAEGDGRINAETRAVYENLLKEHPEDGKKALAALNPKKRIVNHLGGGDGKKESPWDKRQREIKEKLNL